MFYSLTGKVVFSDLSSVAIECGGVAFRCFTSATTLRDIDKSEAVTLFTYLSVREDALDLYGFSTEYEREWFKLLISVSGVGGKAAIAILSAMTVDKLMLCISVGDSKSITKANGVGPKLAQRIILELKNKVKSFAAAGDEQNLDSVSAVGEMPNTGEAIAALTMLGYSQAEASVAVSKLDPSLSVQDLIKQGLKLLSRKV